MITANPAPGRRHTNDVRTQTLVSLYPCRASDDGGFAARGETRRCGALIRTASPNRPDDPAPDRCRRYGWRRVHRGAQGEGRSLRGRRPAGPRIETADDER